MERFLAMRKEALLVFGVCLVMVVLAGISVRKPSGALGSVIQDADAAFRDGAYQAKIDVAASRTPRFRVGRWNSDADRASFIAGYQQSYRRFAEAAGRPPELSAAELLGYPDGLMDGRLHRRTAQPFQFDQTDNYRNADRGYSAAQVDHEVYRQHYRQAYSDGYRQGYYSVQDRAQLKPMSATWNR